MSKRFRIFISVVLILITLLSFKGFPYAAYDVKNTTVIQGVGIDYDEKEGFILTVEIFDASQSSGVDEVSSGNLTKVITVKGEDISSAMDELTLKIGKTLIYSQKRVVVISKDALRVLPMLWTFLCAIIKHGQASLLPQPSTVLPQT